MKGWNGSRGEAKDFFSAEKVFRLSPNPPPFFKKSGVFCYCGTFFLRRDLFRQDICDFVLSFLCNAATFQVVDDLCSYGFTRSEFFQFCSESFPDL